MKLTKKIIPLIFVAMLTAPFNGCKDYLNMEYLLNDRLDMEEVFLNIDHSKRWLAGVYSHLRHTDNWDVSIKEQNSNQFNFISDDMYYTDREKADDYVFGQLASYRIYRAGQYTEQFLQNQWRECYIGIRDASIYIHNIDNLSKGDNIREGMNAEQLATYIKETKAEARFLRAYYYWQLLRKYGPIPIVPDEGVDFTKSYDELSIERSPYDVCVDYIAEQMALAARDLPLDRTNREVMKPTKGAALAARAKAYLFGASPQYNGNTSAWAKRLISYDGTPLIDPVYKEERWAKAAAAAKEVMDLGVYKLYTVPKRTVSSSQMQGAQYSALGFSYYRYPKTIEPNASIVAAGAGWDVRPQEAPGYDDAPFGDGGTDCGWADIDPCESYRQLFDGSLTAYANPELIFTRGYDNLMDNLSIHQMPRSLGGWNCHGLTMKMFDAYYMADGTDFYRYKPDPEDPENYYISDPRANVPDYAKSYAQNTDSRRWDYYMSTAARGNGWVPLSPGVSFQNGNREPRFYASVAYNGSIWENEGEAKDGRRYNQIFTYRNGGDGKDASGFYYWTGIGIRKYYHPEDWSGNRIRKAEPAIRYAEVLLIYAEALNELSQTHNIPSYTGTGTISISRNQTEISRGLRPVRVRGGLKDITDEHFGNKNEMRKRIKREWQIEFMGEAHRYFDLRRWGDAEREESMPVWGYNMDMTGPLKFNESATNTQRELWYIPHEISLVPAIFAEKMYLWPISKDELRKNRKLTQNPGWQTFDE
ncbi:MAG: RagB/SusD family nutrient uptake outer membrane protein [Paludibacter sp.]|jgi:hypothetical protein|nr:RagB/SusD family nutrient uptake outer membrane protein [Paludibacter sp.]